MFDIVRRLRRENPAALRLDRPAKKQRQLVRLIDRRLEIDSDSGRHLGWPIDDEPERAIGTVLTQENDASNKIWIDELRHRKQQRWRQGHEGILSRHLRDADGLRSLRPCPFEGVGNKRIASRRMRGE